MADLIPFIVCLVIVLPVSLVAYRKYRRETREAWERMPPGDDEEVIPPNDPS